MRMRTYADSGEVSRLARGNPFNRNGEPDDIAELVHALVGPAFRWVTGQVIRPDGGSTLGFGGEIWSETGLGDRYADWLDTTK